MKILLIAYEFPPSPSPQSLRWTYLSRELVRHGHDVHVLTPDLGPELGPPNAALDPRVNVHRTYAGPMRGFIAWHRRRRAAAEAFDAAPMKVDSAPVQAAPRPQRTPLKAKLVNVAFRVSERLWFPDIRGEWRAFARRALRRLLAEHDFDVVVSSHEPATSIQLALDALRLRDCPWIADLGDPVLAPYTPRRWRVRSAELERRTLQDADCVTVTAASAAELLDDRHNAQRRPVVLTQGFEEREVASLPNGSLLELAYAGSFYAFRRADALFEAVAATAGVRLSVATVALPDSLRAIAEAFPARFRLLGFLDHSAALALQESAHVLVNIANRDASQVPGKLYEYLGAARPILHVTHGGDDPGAELVRTLARGWTVDDDRDAIESELTRLRDSFTNGSWLSSIDLTPGPVQPYSWTAIGARLDALLRDVTTHHARRACSTPGNSASLPSTLDSWP